MSLRWDTLKRIGLKAQRYLFFTPTRPKPLVFDHLNIGLIIQNLFTNNFVSDIKQNLATDFNRKFFLPIFPLFKSYMQRTFLNSNLGIPKMQSYQIVDQNDTIISERLLSARQDGNLIRFWNQWASTVRLHYNAKATVTIYTDSKMAHT